MFEIREVRPDDAEGIVQLSNQLGYPPPATAIKKLLNLIIEDPEHVVYVALSQENDLAGYIHVFLAKRLFLAPFAEVGGLVIDEKFRGNRLGNDLLTRAERWASHKACKEMRIRSNIIRENAHGFYLGQGYVINKNQVVFSKNL